MLMVDRMFVSPSRFGVVDQEDRMRRYIGQQFLPSNKQFVHRIID
jgi:hypothetical protein